MFKFKARALAETPVPTPFVADSKPASAFTPDFRFAADSDDTRQLRTALAQLSPVGAVIEEALRQSTETSVRAPEVDEALIRAEAFAAGRDAAIGAHEAELAAARRMIAALHEGLGRQLAIDPVALAPSFETLVLAIARAVIADELVMAPQSVRARVAGALATMAEDMVAELRIHPDDRAFFMASDELRSPCLRITPDAAIERGDFRLRCGDSELIDRIAERFGKVDQALRR